MKNKILTITSTLIVFSLFSVNANAEGLLEVLKRINEIPPAAAKTVVSFGFFVGLVFIAGSFIQLRQLGMAGMGNFNTYKNPLYSFTAGLLLIFITSVTGIGGHTIFGDGAKDVTATGDIKIKY